MQTDPITEESRRIVLDWLRSCDAGEPASAWKQAARYLRTAISESDFVSKLEQARGPLGAVLSRKLDSVRSVQNLPSAPRGEYVVIEFRTEFEGGVRLGERVTTMKDDDGQLKVAGYYLI